MTIVHADDTDFRSVATLPATPVSVEDVASTAVSGRRSRGRVCDGALTLRDADRRGVVLALAVVVLLVLLGGVCAGIAAQLQSSGADTNKSLVDVSATAEVSGKVSDELSKILSYRYDKPELSEKAASVALTGSAKSQYEQLFSTLRKKAPGQKLVLEAKVVAVGVQSMRQDSAELLVFVDQTTMRASDKGRNAAAAQLHVTAIKDHGQWRIGELRTL